MSQFISLAIIGMGPTGLMIAHHARRFFKNISVFGLPTGPNEKMAGRAAGGMLAPAYECFGEYSDDYVDFALNSRQLWNELAKEMAINIDENAIAVANNNAMVARIEQMQSEGRRFGLKMPRISVPQGITAQSAIRLDCDALIDPLAVLNIFHAKLEKDGVDFRCDIVNLVENGRIYIEGAPQSFDIIIIAAGYNSVNYANNYKALSNLKPVRGQTLLISHPPAFNGSIRNETTYLMSRGNATAVGATSSEAEDWNIHESEIAQLSKMARDLMPELSKGQIIANFAGIRPQTTDGLPILGALGENIFFAGGANRNGWLIAPLLAKRLVENITNGAPIEKFIDVARFS